MSEDAHQLILCVSCLTENSQAQPFCRKCGAPISTTATLDPINQIQAQGHLFRTALRGRPRFIVLLGIWMMFFPVLLVSVSVAIHLITSHDRRSDFVFFWAVAGLAYVSLVILYRITKNYLTISNKDLESD
jgi:hypothetical protein